MLSASCAMAMGSSATDHSSRSARSVATTIALEPPRPTARGIVVSQRTELTPAAAGASSRANRATVAATRSDGGSIAGRSDWCAIAIARFAGSDRASTAPL
jgi:hypothetical protein